MRLGIIFRFIFRAANRNRITVSDSLCARYANSFCQRRTYYARRFVRLIVALRSREWCKLHLHSDVFTHCTWLVSPVIPSSTFSCLILGRYDLYSDEWNCILGLCSTLGANEFPGCDCNHKHYFGDSNHWLIHCNLGMGWLCDRRVNFGAFLYSAFPFAVRCGRSRSLASCYAT